MSNPKRHHYLPRFYLDRFCGDGLLWVHDRQSQQMRRDKPSNIAVERYYYSLIEEDGTKNNSVEEWLARLEGVAKPVFDKLDANHNITDEERFFLALFLGVLYCRVPRHEREANEILTDDSRSLLRRNLLDPIASKTFTSGSPEELLKYVESEQFGLRFDRNWLVATMAEYGRELGKWFFISEWVVLRAPTRTSFATCDVPFGILSSNAGSRPVGVASPEATKAIPLSSRTCLLLCGSQMGFSSRKAKAGEVRRVNIAVLRETERYAMARDETHLRSLVRTAELTSQVPLTRMVVDDLPHPSGDSTRSISVTRRTSRKPPAA